MTRLILEADIGDAEIKGTVKFDITLLRSSPHLATVKMDNGPELSLELGETAVVQVPICIVPKGA